MMKNNEKQKAEIMGINRHRMGTDGKGISTLITFYGCKQKEKVQQIIE